MLLNPSFLPSKNFYYLIIHNIIIEQCCQRNNENENIIPRAHLRKNFATMGRSSPCPPPPAQSSQQIERLHHNFKNKSNWTVVLSNQNLN